MTHCRRELVLEANPPDRVSLVGELAHIVSGSPGGPRYIPEFPSEEIDSHSNLLLLCNVHHKLVDDQPNHYSIDRLRRLKGEHEEWVRKQLLHVPDASFDVPKFVSSDSDLERSRKQRPSVQDMARLSEAVERAPEDAESWEALAWAQYETFRYVEALESLRRARVAKPRRQQTIIRACILTEQGKKKGDRAQLIEAERIFRKVAAERGDAVDHYNLGNVLTALERHEEAEEQYRLAIRLAPEHVETWKNLASTLHLLGRHDEEMECFEEALRLDPSKPQALAGLGVTYLVDHSDYASAVRYLEAALDEDAELWLEWSHIWYWLGLAHHQLGDPIRALEVLEEGLAVDPSSSYLRHLKGTVLASSWRTHPELQAPAGEYLQFMLEVSPFAFAVRSELGAILEESGAPEEAWRLVDEAFDLLTIPRPESTVDLGISLSAVLRTLRYLPDYAAFRDSHPIDDYFDEDDPLLDDLPVSGTPPVWPETIALMSQVSAIAFGLFCDEMSEVPDENERVDALIAGHDAASVILLGCTPLLALRSLSAEYGQEREEFYPIFDIPIFMSYALLREVSRIGGFVIGVYGVPDKSRDTFLDILPAEDFSLIAAEVALRAIAAVGAEDIDES